jgi:hypothetical protein
MPLSGGHGKHRHGYSGSAVLVGVSVHFPITCGNGWWGACIRQYLNGTHVSFDMFTDPADIESQIKLMGHEGRHISLFVTISSNQLHLPENFLIYQLSSAEVIAHQIHAAK